MTNYKSEYVVQQKILGDWVDVKDGARSTQLAASVLEDSIHFENQTGKSITPETRILLRETYTDISERVVG